MVCSMICLILYIKSSLASHLTCSLLHVSYYKLNIFTEVGTFPVSPLALFCDVICESSSELIQSIVIFAPFTIS